MIKRNQGLLNQINALTDGVLLLISYLLASWLWLDVVKKTDGNLASLENLHGWMLAALIVFIGGTVFVLALLNVYRTSRIHGESWRCRRVIIGNTLAVAAAAGALYLFRLEDFSRGVLGIYLILGNTVLCLKRVAMHYALRSVRSRGYNLKHIIVIGGGRLAEEYMQSVDAEPELGLCVDCRLIPGLGMLTRLEELLHGTGVDEVVLALDVNELYVTQEVIYICEKSGTKISVVPFFNDIIPTNPTVDVVGNVKLIRLRTTPLDNPFNAFIKRAFDVCASGVLLLILSPVLLVVALGVKLSSPGPVLFRQTRVGLNKEEFQMLKFRSMRVNNEQNTAWSSATDNRRTRFGSFIRKTSLDELPQLWNVFRGDMSLVGPRPEIPHFVEQFREEVPLYMVKHQVRPGITGWAQVNGLRGDTSIPDRIRCDLWYIEHWSFLFDIRILIKTALGGMINSEKL